MAGFLGFPSMNPISPQSKNSTLISKVHYELNTLLGLNDIELSNFITHLGQNSVTFNEFDDELIKSGINILNQFVSKLFDIIIDHERSIVSNELARLKLIEENEKIKVLIQENRQNLPIYSVKKEFLQAVNDNRVLIVSGGVGSGKTTQITQYLVEGGYVSDGRVIGCTQPYREFVGSVAERVADEYGCKLGEQVGYATSFEDYTSECTLIKYMTDDLLLREMIEDQNLLKYSVVVIDEVDARIVYTDVLIGLLKLVLKQRRGDFRLVVVTTPLWVHKIPEYFSYCNEFNIPAKTYHHVREVYLDVTPRHFLQPALKAIDKILVKDKKGDILLFWHDDDEIDVVVCHVRELVDRHQDLITMELFILLVDKELDSSVFKPTPPGKRKLVIASSRFAEVCMSTDGISYVIDPGVALQKGFNPQLSLDFNITKPISRTSASQRARLAKRMPQGTCYHLYSLGFCDKEMPRTNLEIESLNLRSIVLIMKAVGIQDLNSFNFIDPPPPEALTSALERLYGLGALDKEGHLTQLGWQMVAFPLDPPLSKILMAGVDLGCSDEILTIISMIQSEATYYSPMQLTEVQGKRAKFFHGGGDFLTMLAIYEEGKAQDFSEKWCKEYCILPPLIQRAQFTRNKLVRIMQEKLKLQVVNSGVNSWKIRKAIALGFLFNMAEKDEKGVYRRLVDNQKVVIDNPGVFKERDPKPEWVVSHWFCEQHINGITAVDPLWFGRMDINRLIDVINILNCRE